VCWSRVPARWWVAALVVHTGLGAVAPASAEVQHVPLAWNAPPGCPTAAAVLADVERNLAASGEGRAPFMAVGNVSEVSTGLWRAKLVVEVRGGRAEREFEAESCEAVAGAAGLIIALAAQVGDGGQEAEARGPVVAEETDDPPGAPAPYWRRAPLGVMVSGLVGTMPETVGAGLEIASGPSWSAPGWRLRALVGAGFLFRRGEEFNFVYGNFWRVAVSGRGCVSAGAELEVGVCVGGDLSAMHANGPFGSGLSDDTLYWIAPALSAMASWNVHPRLAIFARTDVTVPVTHGSFRSDGGGDVYTVPTIVAGGALGVELHFR
jgi:hypothetical protein